MFFETHKQYLSGLFCIYSAFLLFSFAILISFSYLCRHIFNITNDKRYEETTVTFPSDAAAGGGKRRRR